MELESAEVVLWFIPGLSADNWYWELTLNGELAARSVDQDQATARKVAKWVAQSLDVDYREAPDEEAQRKSDHEKHQAWAKQKEGLGLMTPKKRDLMDLFQDPPPDDQ